MNEVSKIHLSRQAFTISVDAKKELKAYLDAIAKQVDNDVTEEVEMRMAELLVERGINGEKVILPADIAYLKEQLGEPKDFKEDDEPSKATASSTEKRLFRDTESGMIAGVASGLAAYLGVDVLLVRIVLVIAALAWGFAIPIYIVLWLLVPEAKTSSDRLQMAGKPITVEGLKEVVERADVKGAAHRASTTLSGPAAKVRDMINGIFRLLVKIIGIGLTLAGLMSLLGIAIGGLYFALHGSVIDHNLFPIGIKEDLLVYFSFFVAAMMSVFVILFGMAIFARKWPIRGWLTGVLVGLTFVGIVGTSALAADTVPRVQDRYQASLHTETQPVDDFKRVEVYGDNVSVDYRQAKEYSVSYTYFDNPDLTAIKTSVKKDTLTIDTSGFDQYRNCDDICIPDMYDLTITVYSPETPRVDIDVPNQVRLIKEPSASHNNQD